MKGRRTAQINTVSAPTGGWNSRDSLAAMAPGDAVILDNFVPSPTQCKLRYGSTNHVTGITGTVETLAVYNKADGTSTMFAAAGSAIYDVSIAGPVGAAVQSGLSNARFQTVNYAATSGKYIYFVNGADSARLWNGTAWVTVTGASSPAITGVTTSTLVHVNVFQRRLWFVQKDTFKVWYLPVDSIGGAALSFDFSALFRQGGYLMAMGTWTLDSGTGMDDHAVFMSSEGEIAVYRGTDPNSAATWYLVGVYTVGQPIGRRCYTNYASDLLIISKDGVLPMSKALASSRVTTGISISDKIQLAMTDAITNYGANFGWELALFPEENLLIMNVPVTTGAEQYVMNTLNGSWCRFTGWLASAFARMGSSLYFGGDGAVVKAWSGFTDLDAPINAEALTSFQYHGGVNQKRYTMARPIIAVDSTNIGILLGLNLDFDITAPSGVPSLNPVTVSLWDVAVWDSSAWAGELSIVKNWQTIGGVGMCAGLHIKLAAQNTKLQWQSVDYVYETGVGVT